MWIRRWGWGFGGKATKDDGRRTRVGDCRLTEKEGRGSGGSRRRTLAFSRVDRSPAFDLLSRHGERAGRWRRWDASELAS